MGDQVVPSHSTHGKSHSLFYEGDHGNNDLRLLFEGIPLTQKVQQGDTLGNMIQSPKPLHTYGGIY